MTARGIALAVALFAAATGGWIGALASGSHVLWTALGALLSLLIVSGLLVVLVQTATFFRAVRSAAEQAARGEAGTRIKPPKGGWLLDGTWSLVASLNGMLGRLDDLAQRVGDSSNRDSLTGCYSHRYLHERLEQEMQRAERYDHVLSLLLIDVDDLHDVNERYGYSAGDEVLKEVAAQVMGKIRRTDLVARYGGDELAVLLPETDLPEALQVAGKIQSAAGKGNGALPAANGATERPSVRTTVSIGVATFPRHSVRKDGLVRAADMAMYMAKYSGKNTICEFNHVPGASKAADPYQLGEFLENSDWGALQALVAAVDARDHITGGHSRKVSEYAAILAEAIGLSEADVEAVRTAALLHDVGKIGITDRVLVKNGELSPDERKLIETHPSSGEALVRGAMSRRSVLEGVLYHHEHYDGEGYPYGLARDEIPICARIIAVADAYDAMTSYRHYRTPPGRAKARMRLELGAGRQWDPELVQVFLRLEAAGCLDEMLEDSSRSPAGGVG